MIATEQQEHNGSIGRWIWKICLVVFLIFQVLQKVYATFIQNDASISETKKMLNNIKDFLIPALGVISIDILVEMVKLTPIPSNGYVHNILENTKKNNKSLENIKTFLQQSISKYLVPKKKFVPEKKLVPKRR